jgi:hypothetical protein
VIDLITITGRDKLEKYGMKFALITRENKKELSFNNV